jgi:hypothetical protein|nr:MAG TPA: hypothetical protein [Siphoviridae sp. ctIwT7]
MTDEQLEKAIMCWTGTTVSEKECMVCPYNDKCTLEEIANEIIHRWRECKTENAALRERLEKAVELPVNIGDVKYIISSDKSCVLEEKVIAVQVTKYEYSIEVDEIYTKNQYGTIEGFKINQWNGAMAFTNREAAEARLAELKGEER